MKRAYGTARLILEVIGLTMLVVTTLFVLAQWAHLPAWIPTHVAQDGSPDAWQSKFALLRFPLIGGGCYVLLTVSGVFTRRLRMPVRVSDSNKELLNGILRLALATVKVELAGVCCSLTWHTLSQKRVPGLLVWIFLFSLVLTVFSTVVAVSIISKRK